ncbi:(d)CMP kinase [Candidatus Profftia sp. (ex Adelges kitamiensis)]|uniref:(d)CMP kinase n=1 Tax=Candidatus Profftia sp. (ex Adelges kitamiensis) TaxID=2864218 RepID=UPI001CE3751D|nr:(d)CMP kinase [Candidatus Profftia sp. (ex Adelges kitamiensis)]
MSFTTPPVITVDGPSGAGKSALCKALARYLGWYFLDSGKFYRILAFIALQYKVDYMSEKELVSLSSYLNIFSLAHSNQLQVLFRGKDLSYKIKTELIGRTASQVATFPCVREALLYHQRAARKFPGLIADGRDMGTIVFPDASVKIFLYASPQERARRRLFQLQKNGFSVNLQFVSDALKKRDNCDYNRALAPLIPAQDVLMLDSTYISLEEVIIKALAYAKHRLLLVI